MNRKVLLLSLFVSLMGFSLFIPSTNYDDSLTSSLLYPNSSENVPSGIGDNFEDFIDTLSDFHSPSDIGTHNVFSDLQDFGSNYNQMRESDTGSAGYNLEDYVDQQSNLHAPVDVGTHSDFAEMQDIDSTFDTLTEANTGTPTIDENLYIDTAPTPVTWIQTGISPYLDTQNYPTSYISTASNGAVSGWYDFAATSGTAGVFTVILYVYCGQSDDDDIFWELDWTGEGTADASGTFVDPTGAWYNSGAISGLDSVSEINACRIRFTMQKGLGAPVNNWVDAAYLNVYQAGTNNYDLDLEVGWTGADYDETNEYVCIYGGTQGTEALRVDVWDGSVWQNVISDIATGWNNVSVTSYLTSSTFEIRFTDTSDDSTAQDTWQVEGVLLHVWTVGSANYELDLEVGWTTADFDEQNEELCIYPVTGGGWPSEDIKIDVWNGTWSTILPDLTPDQWNNVSVSSYLTSSALEIRFLGGTETGDTTQSTWEVDTVLIHSWTVSYAPVNDQAPTLDNPSDTDNMYAQYQEYQVTSHVSDQNGFGDIDYLEIGLWDTSGTTEYCRFRYDEDTNAFTEVYDIGTVVSLNAVSSTAIESGNDIDATFYFTVDWDFPDSSDLVAKCYVVDTQNLNDADSYGSPSITWDVETRLDYTGPFSVDDGSGTGDRGNLDSSFSLTGTVIYYTSTNAYPSSTAVDIWVSTSEYGTNIGPWSDTDLTSGVFDVTCYADDVIGEDTYTVKVVEEGAGSGGTDLYHAASATDTYIADRLIITITDPTDQRINIGANATGIIVSAIYDYDDSSFDGLLTLNDTTFDYGDIGKRGYTVSSASGGTHGVALIGINDATYCIWDSVTITITGPTDNRQNLNANATGIIVSGVYDYDGTAFDGTYTLNNTDFDGDGTAVRWYYTVSSIGGGTHGITVISTNDYTYHIWDSLTIAIVGPTDNRQNLNANASGIIVSAVYDYDGAVFDGIFTLNNTDFDGDGTAVKWGYTVLSVSGDSFGITTISSNDETFMIWDSITITFTGPTDNRQNLNANASDIVVTAVYDYDGTSFDGSFILNNTDFDGDGTAVKWGYTVLSVSGDSYGITTISSNDETFMIWDSVTITITGPTDNRQNLNANASGIIISAAYDYDGAAFDGTFTLNNTDFDGDGTAVKWGYTVLSVSGDSFGITTISSNDETFMIWDSITITIVGPTDNRQNLNANASGIIVSAVYDYDGVAFDGIFTLNNTDFDGDGTAVKWGYTVLSVSGDSYGITTISLNDETFMIWDSVTITITGPTDNRQNLNANASGIIVSAIYDYDGTVFDGTFILNNTDFDGDGTAVKWGYTVLSVFGDSFDITTISSNDETFMIWDSITITIAGPTDNRQNLNANASGIIVSAVYDYDGATFDGTFTLNNTDFDGDGTAVKWGYTVLSVSGDGFGITTISSNDETFMIWDSITITITGPTDNRQNLNANASGIIISAVYDYDGATFDGTFTLNNTDFDGDGTAVKWGYTILSVSGDGFGITTISSNDETFMIWDSVTITITGPTDNRQNLNANASGIIVTAVYDYDSTPFDGTFTLNNTDYDGDGTAVKWGYTVLSISGDSYGITTISSNDETFMIWDSITIIITGPTDNRQNLNTNASGIIVSAVYDYDGSVFDGSFTLNNTDFDGDGTAVKWGYTVLSVSGDGFGITTISSNDETFMIWDSITISIVGPTDNRQNLNVNASGIIVSAVYDYDGAEFDGTFTLNNTDFDGDGTAVKWGYTVLSVSGDSYGITTISSNDETFMIWDSITITITGPTDNRQSINANASGIIVSAIYDYDGSVFDGTFTLNNTDFDGDGTAVKWGYTVLSVSGDGFGITTISSNDETYMIWDQLVIMIGVDDSTPLNGVQANFTLAVLFDYDDTVCTSYQIAIHRNGTWWYSFTDTNKSSFVDANIDDSYTYTVFVVTSESTYGVLSFSTNSQQVVWSAAPNSAPVNDSAPNLSNPDDTDNLYARYNYYIITSSVSDADGYNDIDYIELTLYDNSRTTPVWTVRYTVSGDIFTVELGGTYITLSTSSFAVGFGNDLDVTWYIKIGWDHLDLTDVDMKQYVHDGKIGDEDFYESDWDVETRLEITGLTIDDGSGTENRGPLDGAFTVSGTLIFLGSVDNYPLANETDVWVSSSEYGTSIGPWSDLSLTSGQFSLTVYADDEVGQDTLTIKAVIEAAGSGGTDLLSSTTQSTYITDQIAVQSYAALDPRIDINDAATIDVELLYEYDSSPVINGSVTINGIAATHQGSGTWRFTDTKSSVQLFTYDTVAYSGGIHGLTQVNQNAMTQDVIWDQIVVQTTLANATRVDVGAYVEIRVTLWLAYDSSFLGSGDTVTLAGSSMNWDFSDGRFELIVSQASVGSWIYYVNSSSESNFGITSLNLSGNNVSVIWDRIQVQSYSVSDNHVNIGDSVDIDVILYYDYDDSPVTDGTITVNGISASHQGAGLWRFSDSESIVVMNTYNLVAGSGNIHGLTVVDQNTQSQNVIWDRLVIVIGVDDASSVNGHQANFTLSVTFEYNSAVCTTYQLVIDRNGTWWHSFVDGNVSQFVDTNTDVTYFYNASLVSSESTYDITAFTTTTQQVTWSVAPNEIPVNDSSPVLTNGDDTNYLYARYRFYIITTSVSDLDGYTDISYVELTLYSDDQITPYWTIRYTTATDTFSLESGSSIVIADVMSYATGAGNTLTITWYIKIGWNHDVLIDTDILQFVSDGIDSASNYYETNWNFETRLDYSTSPSLSDDRGNINTADLIGSGSVTYYGSSHSPLANETDVWIIRDGVETWSGDLSAGSFSISSIGSPATIGLNNYTFKIVVQGSGSGGTDLYYTTSLIATFITDRIEIYEAGVVDGRIDINSYCEVWWRARYEYDDFTIQSGLILDLNGSRTLVWDALGLYWRWQETSTSPSVAWFDVASASESTYGLTEWFESTSVQQVIWDALNIIITDPTDAHVNVGANATGIVVSATYAFDNTPFDGVLTLNNTNFVYTSPQIQWYTVLSATFDAFNITAILSNDITYCIWDRVLIVSVLADELYHDPGDNVRISVEIHFEYDDSPVVAGEFNIAGYSLTHVGSGIWETYVTLGSYIAITFDDLTLCNATDHGISEYNMDSNEVTVYWDRIEFYSVSSDDGRVGVGESVDIQWGARLETAGIIIPTGISVSMTGDISCIPSGGLFVASVTQSTVGSTTYSIISASLGEINNFVQSVGDITIIWDRIKAITLTATSLSQDAGLATEIRATLAYEFDDTPFTNGEVFLTGESVSMTYNSVGGYWTISITKTLAGNYAFTIGSITDSLYGVSAFDPASLSVEVEWIAVPGFTLDTMTLMLIGGGAGIVLIGVALIASRRRRGGVSIGVGEIEVSDFGIPEPTITTPAEPEIIETDVAPISDGLGPDARELLETELLAETAEEGALVEDVVAAEVVEPEAEAAAPVASSEMDVYEPEVTLQETELEPIEDSKSISIPEDSIALSEEPDVPESMQEEVLPTEEGQIEVIEAETDIATELDLQPSVSAQEPQIDEAVPSDEEYIESIEAESIDVIPEPVSEPEILPESEIVIDKSLTKKELLDRLPPEIRDALPEEDVKRMSKKEVRSLLESYTPAEEPLPEVLPDSIPAEMPDVALRLEDLSKLDKKVLLELLPDDIKSTASPRELRRLSKKEIISLLESFLEPEK